MRLFQLKDDCRAFRRDSVTYLQMWWTERSPTTSQVWPGGCEIYTRFRVNVGQVRATSCTRGQWHSCTFQCVAGAYHFLHPWPVTLVYISVCGRRVPLLAPMASDTRAHFSVRQARVTSCNKWLADISACVTADAAGWSRNVLDIGLGKPIAAYQWPRVVFWAIWEKIAQIICAILFSGV